MLEGSSENSLERVADFGGPMPPGVTVSEFGRTFVNFPRWGDDVPATVTELIDGQPVAYPDEVPNSPRSDDDRDAFVSVQSVVVDPVDRLWVLDTGSPMMRPTKLGGPKLVCVDMESNSVTGTIVLPRVVAPETTYLNDVRFDLRRGGEGLAFITDSSSQGPNALIVVDLATGESWRRLHEHSSTRAGGSGTFRPVVEGHPFVQRSPDGTVVPVAMGADGITINADGSRLHYCPLASRRLYSVSVDALADRSSSEDAVVETVVDEGDKAPARTASRPTTRDVSTSPRTSTTPSFDGCQTGSTRRSPTPRSSRGVVTATGRFRPVLVVSASP